MFKRSMVFLITSLSLSSFAYAQEKYTVSGEVIFPKKADIYMELRTQEEAEKDRTPSPPRFIILKLSYGHQKAKRALFEFVDVPKGTYCIRAFQDIYKNGKLDIIWGLGLPKPEEPNGFYKPAWPPDWNKMKFDVDKDVTGIRIELRLGP
jgi:uncharacterized protein (DUF2141 family)